MRREPFAGGAVAGCPAALLQPRLQANLAHSITAPFSPQTQPCLGPAALIDRFQLTNNRPPPPLLQPQGLSVATPEKFATFRKLALENDTFTLVSRDSAGTECWLRKEAGSNINIIKVGACGKCGLHPLPFSHCCTILCAETGVWYYQAFCRVSV